jgi:acyl-coenzyme A thioesterase PaaI-like protein
MLERREILNPFCKGATHNYMCFGCAPDNPVGLKLTFYEENGSVFGVWKPNKHYQGYNNVMHGGIQATLMDEVACWFVYTQIGSAGVTKSMDVKYNGATRISEDDILIKASLIEETIDGEVLIETQILCNNKITASAKITYFVYPKEVAIKRYNYPGKSAFFAN